MMRAFPKPSEIEKRVQLSKVGQREQLNRKFVEQDGLCAICGCRMNRIYGDMRCATRDHITPQPAGCKKDDSENNIQIVCWKCNYEKGSRRQPRHANQEKTEATQQR